MQKIAPTSQAVIVKIKGNTNNYFFFLIIFFLVGLPTNAEGVFLALIALFTGNAFFAGLPANAEGAPNPQNEDRLGIGYCLTKSPYFLGSVNSFSTLFSFPLMFS